MQLGRVCTLWRVCLCGCCPPLQDWPDNWQPRGIPCGPTSSRVCKPHLNPARFTGVQVLGVDEHVWHHQDRRRRGPRDLTGIVDLTRGKDHPTARLLDLIPGRSGTVYKNWLEERGEQFHSDIQIATLDPLPRTARTPSTTNSKTPPTPEVPFTSSSSLACVAAAACCVVGGVSPAYGAGDPIPVPRVTPSQVPSSPLLPGREIAINAKVSQDRDSFSGEEIYLTNLTVRFWGTGRGADLTQQDCSDLVATFWSGRSTDYHVKAEYLSNSCTITADYAREARHAFTPSTKTERSRRAFPRDPYARGAAHYRLMPPAKRGVPSC